MAQDHPLWSDSQDWPRWLLHTNTLTSFPWQPGNKYGDIYNPTYNAVSYTWGRFRTLSTNAEPLPVAGITRKAHLPRIKEDHFSIDDLQRMIKTTTCPFPGYNSVEYLWIDIACIDQTPDSAATPNRAKASEIGRQAEIFRGAKDVFVWLTSQDAIKLIGWTERFGACFDHLAKGKSLWSMGSQHMTWWLNTVQQSLDDFIEDPWFRSLWTLQEGFLRPDAIFLLRDGMSEQLINLCRNDAGKYDPWTLRTWIAQWHMVLSELGHESWKPFPQAVVLSNNIRNMGLLEATRDQWLTAFLDDDEYPDGFIGNPFSLLVASTHRRPKRAEDQVYGIMQVFDLRLGISRPGATRNYYNLDELTDELGAELVKQYPIASQLITQSSECLQNKAWRINWAMTLPQEAHRFWRHLAQGGQVYYDISEMCTETDEGTRKACFTGKVTAYGEWYHRVGLEFSKFINLDAAWVTMATSSDPSLADSSGTERRDLLFRWMLDILPGLQILLLGRTRGPPKMGLPIGWQNYENWGIGLLIAPVVTAMSFQRVGTVTWDLDWEEEAHGYAHGNGPQWTIITRGVFG